MYYGFLFAGILASCALTHGFTFKPGSALVRINKTVKTLTRSTSCKPKYWSNNQESACMCCVTKKSLRSQGFFVDAESIPHCLKKGHCTESIVQGIGQKLNIDYNATRNRQLTTQIIDHVKVFEDLGRFDVKEFQKGKLTPLGAERIIRELSKRNLIAGDTYRTAPCLFAQTISGSGAQTVSLYEIQESSKCTNPNTLEVMEPVYILKQLKKKNQEVLRLAQIHDSFLNQYNLSNADRPSNFPAIALDALSITGKSEKGTTFYASIFPMAPGRSLYFHLKDFAENFKNSRTGNKIESAVLLQKTSKIMYELGLSLGRLHKHHMTQKNGRLTGKSFATHGDLHGNNIFIGPKNSVVLIDPESMAKSLKKAQPVGLDLTRIYTFSTLRSAKHQNQRMGNIGMKEWHKMIIDPFFEGYVRAYAFDERGRFLKEDFEDIMKILRQNFSILGTRNDVLAVYIKTGPIRTIWAYRKHIRRILQEIEANIQNELKT